MKILILQLFLECLDHDVAQLLRGYFCGDLCVIVLGVIIAPFVVFISTDLSGNTARHYIQSCRSQVR